MDPFWYAFHICRIFFSKIGRRILSLIFLITVALIFFNLIYNNMKEVKFNDLYNSKADIKMPGSDLTYKRCHEMDDEYNRTADEICPGTNYTWRQIDEMEAREAERQYDY